MPQSEPAVVLFVAGATGRASLVVEVSASASLRVLHRTKTGLAQFRSGW